MHHYNAKRYWTYRFLYYDKSISKIKRIYYRYYISKSDNQRCASISLDTPDGRCNFASPPLLAHDGKGVIIAGGATVGKNAYIAQFVTIGRDHGECPVVGDDCFLGTGCVVIGGIHIGNNVRIAPNVVVSQDIPDNATVVPAQPRVIVKDPNYHYDVKYNIWG